MSAAAYSPTAEQAVLGTALLFSDTAELVARTLDPADFYVPACRVVAEAVMALAKVGMPIDAVIAANWIVERHGRETLDRVGGLPEIVSWTTSQAVSRRSAEVHAATIKDRAVRRAIKAALIEGTAALDDLSIPPSDIAESIETRLRRVDIPQDLSPPPNVFDFLDRNMSYRWLVPGWLERQDRLILTSIEGGGKSLLLRQLGVQMAAGIHPWRDERPDPVRVLIVDCENSERLIWRRLHHLIDIIADLNRNLRLGDQPIVFDPDRLRVEVRPGGVDLLSRADRRWFTGRVASARPDVLITGPLYKLFVGSVKDEEQQAEIASYLDRLRAEFDLAIMLEAHAPLGNDGGPRRTLRPIGSGLWLRWPEFGFGLRKSPDTPGLWEWEPWRPPRDDDRTWPTRLYRGGRWPWTPTNDDL